MPVARILYPSCSVAVQLGPCHSVSLRRSVLPAGTASGLGHSLLRWRSRGAGTRLPRGRGCWGRAAVGGQRCGEPGCWGGGRGVDFTFYVGRRELGGRRGGTGHSARIFSSADTSLTEGRSSGWCASIAAISAGSLPGRPDRSGSVAGSVTASSSAGDGGPLVGVASGHREHEHGAERVDVHGGGEVLGDLACSGAMHTGVPSIPEVWVMSPVRSSRPARPKSITRGPSAPRITLPGLRSRCSRPAAWISFSPSASMTPSAAAIAVGSGPRSWTYCDRVRPWTYSVANQGGSSSGPDAASRAAILGPADHAEDEDLPVEPVFGLVVRGQVVADRLDRDPAPSGVTPKYTVPMPPSPRRPRTATSPISFGSPDLSGFMLTRHAPPFSTGKRYRRLALSVDKSPDRYVSATRRRVLEVRSAQQVTV